MLLGNVPYGVHSDEAQVGTDAHRILSEGWIGVYTHAALGQPAGHAYLTTPSIWLLGDNAFALRLPLALVALAAIPLLYLLVRVSFGRVEAAFASTLLAVLVLAPLLQPRGALVDLVRDDRARGAAVHHARTARAGGGRGTRRQAR